MRRNGFTMVELIFVIIIIGILSVAALPKFGDIKDRAKINSEYTSLSGIESAIAAKIEFHREDNPNSTDLIIDWHDMGTGGYTGTALKDAYASVNSAKKVLKSIVKKGDDFKIVGSVDKGTTYANPSDGVDDIMIIKGSASAYATGTDEKDSTTANGKPDKNDFWVLNVSSEDIFVYHHVGGSDVKTKVESGEITLIENDSKITAADNTATPGAGKFSISDTESSPTFVATANIVETTANLLFN